MIAARRLPVGGAARAMARADGFELACWLLARGATDGENAILARDIAAALGAGWTDRRIRAAAEAHPAILSAPGCAGYAVLAPGCAASREYARECIARHRSQARHQEDRAARIETALHA